MKITFPYFVTSFQCDCTKQEVISRIEKAVGSQQNNLNMLKKDTVANEKITLQSDTGSYVFVNSFMPIVTVDIDSEENKSFIRMSFKLKKSTRAMLMLLIVFALLFDALLLYFAVTNQLSTSALLLLPAVFLIFSLLLSIFGLHFSSKNVLEILSEAMNGEDAKNYVSVQALKIFE